MKRLFSLFQVQICFSISVYSKHRILFCHTGDDTCWYWWPGLKQPNMAAAPPMPERVKGSEFIPMSKNRLGQKIVYSIGGQDYTVQNRAIQRGFIFEGGQWMAVCFKYVNILCRDLTIFFLIDRWIQDHLMQYTVIPWLQLQTRNLCALGAP